MLARMNARIDRIVPCALVLLMVGGCGDNLKRPADAGVDAAAPDATDGRSIPLVPNPSADLCGAPASATLQHAVVAQGHCAWLFATGLGNPRGMYVDPSGDALVVTTVGGGEVTAPRQPRRSGSTMASGSTTATCTRRA